MKKVFSQIFYIVLFLLVVSLALPYTKLTSVLIIVLVLVWLLEGGIKQKIIAVSQNKVVMVFIAFYFLHILGLIYTENLDTGVRNLEKKLSLLFLPGVLVSGLQVSKRQLMLLFKGFAIVCSCFALYGLFRVLLLTAKEWEAFYGYTGNDYRLALWNFIVIHPTYFSIFLIFSVYIFLISFIDKSGPVILRVLYLIFCVSNFIIIFLLVSRTPLVVFFTSLILGGAFYCYKKRKILIGLIFFIISFSGTVFLLSNIPSVKNRFHEIMVTTQLDKFEPARGAYHTSTNVRIGLLICAKEVIQQNWLWGTGTGDFQDALNNCYQQNGFSDVLFTLRMNAHNQYLQYFIALGLPGLLFFLFCMFYPLVPAFKTRNYLYLLFIYLLVICSLTESIFESNKGIVFFSLFQGLFLSMHKKPEKSNAVDSLV
jgi:hypothetical protein